MANHGSPRCVLAAGRGQTPNSSPSDAAMLPAPDKIAQAAGSGSTCSHGGMIPLPPRIASTITSAPIIGSATINSQRAARIPVAPVANRHHSPAVMIAISPTLPYAPASTGARTTWGPPAAPARSPGTGTAGGMSTSACVATNRAVNRMLDDTVYRTILRSRDMGSISANSLKTEGVSAITRSPSHRKPRCQCAARIASW